MPQITSEQLELTRSLLLNDFAMFAASLGGEKWFDRTLHTDLCRHLQSSGTEMLVILPRSCLKTTIAASYFPLWWAIREKIINNHDVRIMIVSNTAPNAEKTVHQIRALVESHAIIQQFFPEVIPNFGKTRWSDRSACLMRTQDLPEATFESAGVGTNIIRRHYDMIIQDDTIAPSKDELTGNEALPSRDEIEKAIGFHKLTIPLLIDPRAGIRLVIGTRWAEADLLGHILKNDLNFRVFTRKAFKENGTPSYFRFDLEVLEKIRTDMGTYMFSMLYLNTPLSSDVLKFQPEWIQYVENLSPMEQEVLEGGRAVIFVDPADAPTGKKTQDYTAIVGIKFSKNGLFVTRYHRKRLTEGQWIKDSIDMATELGSSEIDVEVNRYANAKHGYDDELKKRGLYIYVKPLKNTRKKEERILGISPIAESHRFFIRKGMRELEEELFTFPRGSHDDIIDAIALSLPHYKSNARIENQKPLEKVDLTKISFEEIFESLTNKNREGCFRWTERSLN